jgi:hypothetical protein
MSEFAHHGRECGDVAAHRPQCRAAGKNAGERGAVLAL